MQSWLAIAAFPNPLRDRLVVYDSSRPKAPQASPVLRVASGIPSLETSTAMANEGRNVQNARVLVLGVLRRRWASGLMPGPNCSQVLLQREEAPPARPFPDPEP